MYRNQEGYPDPTAGAVYSTLRREEKQQEADRLAAISALIPIMKGATALAGFEVVGRIILKDKATGKEYR